jgi:hypothetical protein
MRIKLRSLSDRSDNWPQQLASFIANAGFRSDAISAHFPPEQAFRRPEYLSALPRDVTKLESGLIQASHKMREVLFTSISITRLSQVRLI